MLAQSSLLNAAFLGALSLALCAAAGEPAPERPEDQYRKLLKETGPLTTEALLARYAPPGRFREKLGFDPEKASYYGEVAKALALDEAARGLYARQGLAVCEMQRYESFGDAYYDVLRRNLPVLITTDSILQTVYKSYDDLLADLEENLLLPELRKGLAGAQAALPAVARETGAQDAASLDDLDLLLSVALSLLDEAPPASTRGREAESGELLAIINGGGAGKVALFGREGPFDASQFKPRGHYTRTPSLKRYFRTMIWLGRTGLPLDGPYGERGWKTAALLQEAASRSGAEPSFALIDRIVGFMVGKSDDPGLPAVAEVRRRLGFKTLAAALAGAKEALAGLRPLAGSVRSAGLESDVNNPDTVPVPLEMRLLGQRFALDAFFTEQVTFDRVVAGGQKILRYLPSGLDAAFALGNDAALRPLAKELAAYPYAPNLAACRAMAEAQPPAFWEKDLYSLWLGALRALSRPQGGHVPEAMQTEAWGLKTLQTQLASYAQLRHNTVLYVKQGSSLSSSCEYPTGYVEPYPAFYAALGRYAEKGAGFLAEVPEGEPRKRALAYFEGLGKTVDRLKALSEKELKADPFNEADLKFIKDTMSIYYPGSGSPSYNGWYPGLFYGARKDSVLWDPVVTDVFTDPGGEDHGPHVLHMGVGDVYLAVLCVDSGPDRTACVGPVSSYYEWAAPGLTRMSDEEWKAQLLRKGPTERPEWMAGILAVPPASFERNPRLDQALNEYQEALKTEERREGAIYGLWQHLEGKAVDKRVLDVLEARTVEKGLPETLRNFWARLLADPGQGKEVRTLALGYVLKGLEDPKLRAEALEGFRNLDPKVLDLAPLYARIEPMVREQEVRGSALAALAAFPPPFSEKVTPLLREALQDSNDWTRELAAETLIGRGDAESYPAILKMEKERPTANPHIIAHALIDHGFSASSLKHPVREDPLGPKDKDGRYDPKRLLAALGFPSCDVQACALDALQGRLPAEAREAFLDYLSACDPWLFEKALAVAQESKDPSLYPPVFEIAEKRKLLGTNGFVRFSAALGDAKALPILERAWANPQQEHWDDYSLFRLLQGILRLDPERVIPLLEKPPAENARRSDLINLVRQNPSPRWVASLMTWLSDPNLKEWVQPALKESAGLPTFGDKPEDWLAWWKEAKDLSPAEWRAREAARLMPGVLDTDPKQRAAALRKLRMYGKDVKDRAWLPLLKDPSAEVRGEALTLAFTTAPPEAAEAFRAWIREGGPEDVAAALRILRSSENLTQEARAELLLPQLGIPDPKRRSWVFSQLESICQGQAAFEKALIAAFQDPEPSVRSGAVRAMEYRNLEPCWPQLLGLLKDPDPWVRRSALMTLSRVGNLSVKAKDPACAQALLGVLDDENPEVLKLAVSVAAYAKLQGATERILPLLERKGVSEEAVKAMGALGDDRAVEVLLLLAKNPAQPLCAGALQALSQVRRLPAYRALWDLSQEPDEALRKEALAYFQGSIPYASHEDVLALAKLGPEARKALGGNLWNTSSPEILDWLLEEIPRTPGLVSCLQYQAKVPGALPRILSFAKAADPALRKPLFQTLMQTEGPEAFDLLLASLPPSDQLDYESFGALRSKSPSRFLVLCRSILKDPAFKGKQELIHEMAEAPEEEDRALFKSVAENENLYEPYTRQKAWMALVCLREPKAMSQLLRLEEDDESSGFLFIYGSGSTCPCNAALPALIETLGDPDPKVRDTAHAFLKSITWEAFPADPAPWSAWWEKHRAEFQGRTMGELDR